MTAELVKQIANSLNEKQKRLCTAESCTGGLIAKLCTDLAGSSDWFDRGFVTYSNQAKHDMLGVSMSLIESYGAVSEPVAVAMAQGALEKSLADFSIAVTGIAGPGGGSDEKPVGTVWIAFAGVGGAERAQGFWYAGDRWAIRAQAVRDALSGLLARATGNAA